MKCLNLSKTEFIKVFYILVFSLLTIYTAYISFFRHPNSYNYATDFVQFYTGGLIAKDNITELYNIQYQQDIQSEKFGTYDRAFRSLPFVAYFFSPAAELSFFSALRIYLTLYISALFIMFWFYSSHIKEYLISIALLLGYYPFATSIMNVQTSFLIAISIGLALLLFQKKRFFISGVLFSLLLIKPHFIPIAFFMFVIAKNKRNYLLGYILGSLLLLSIGLFSIDSLYIVDYLSLVLGTESSIHGTQFNLTSSIQSFFYILFKVTDLKLSLLYSILGSLASFIIFWRKKEFIPKELQILVAIILPISFVPHAYIMDCLVVIFPMLLIWKTGLKNFFWALHLATIAPIFKLPFLTFFVYLTISYLILFKKTNVQ